MAKKPPKQNKQTKKSKERGEYFLSLTLQCLFFQQFSNSTLKVGDQQFHHHLLICIHIIAAHISTSVPKMYRCPMHKGDIVVCATSFQGLLWEYQHLKNLSRRSHRSLCKYSVSVCDKILQVQISSHSDYYLMNPHRQRMYPDAKVSETACGVPEENYSPDVSH